MGKNIEIERKYLIVKPNINELESKYNVIRSEIVQTYLRVNDNVEERIRSSSVDRIRKYTHTIKETITGLKRIEKERKITEKEYLELLGSEGTYKIEKERYIFEYKGQVIEIDIYKSKKWGDKAILEVEIDSEKEKINIPPEIEVIKEVTYDENYKNKNIARGV